MATATEKLEKKYAEGLEGLRICIRAKLGEADLCGRDSTFYHDVYIQARALESKIDSLQDEVEEYLSLRVSPPPGRQMGLRIDPETGEVKE